MRDIFRQNTTRRASVARRKENSIGREGTKETRNRDFEDQLRLESKSNVTRPSGEEMDWKSQRKLTHLLSYCKELNIGHCGGVDPLQNGKRGIAHGGGTGNTEAPASPERLNVRWMRVTSECETTGSSGKLTGNRSRRAGLKKGVDVAVRERKTGRKKTKSRTEGRCCKNSLQGKGPGMHR
jgi:hypothetical protein